MDPYKQLVTEFLTEDFVNNYEYHRSYVDMINKELQELAVPFTYTYDEYCKELMERFDLVIDKYFATKETAADFFDSFGEIINNTLDQMRTSKMKGCYEL